MWLLCIEPRGSHPSSHRHRMFGSHLALSVPPRPHPGYRCADNGPGGHGSVHDGFAFHPDTTRDSPGYITFILRAAARPQQPQVRTQAESCHYDLRLRHSCACSDGTRLTHAGRRPHQW